MTKRENGEKVLATSELENTRDFICRFCGRKVILKKGKIKSPHFAHKEKCECHYDKV
ncbi:competence protein CoiA family protein [Paraclostridium sordellii]|uniref:competence protein CoiA family protein n=1 Tax=Paraclostridium sordellii TaxID=1505 RepID=UPI0009BDC3B7